MKRSRKSKGVSWAHGVNLCQVKLFSSEDCPSKVGLISQDHLQAKTSGMLHPYTVEFNDCPPGFEVTHFGNQLEDLSRIPVIEWSCPSKFVMSCNWCVVAGEESKEVGLQNSREMRMLEAVYPRASAIPPDATVSIEYEPYDDSLTPLVPVIPIEEDDCGEESDLAAVGNFLTSSMPMVTSNNYLAPSIPKSTVETSAADKSKSTPAKSPDVAADVAAAGSTALAVLMKINEQGSMIDTDLLLKLLSDPKMIQNLSNYTVSQPESGSAQTSATPPITVTKPLSESGPLSMQKSDITQESLNGMLAQVSNRMPSPITTLPQMPSPLTTLPPHMRTSHASGVNSTSVSPPLPASDPSKVKAPPVPNIGKFSSIGTVPTQPNIALDSVRKEAQPFKDINYYKNLIRQHGDQRGSKEQNLNLGQNGNKRNHLHNLNMIHNMKSENLKPKNQIPCMYFNSSKGCRNGVQCPFKHEMSLNGRNSDVFESQSAKRVRLCGEITGNT